MLLPYNILIEIFSYFDKHMLRKFHGDGILCDELFWCGKSKTEFSVDTKPNNLTWKEIYLSHKIIIPYAIAFRYVVHTDHDIQNLLMRDWDEGDIYLLDTELCVVEKIISYMDAMVERYKNRTLYDLSHGRARYIVWDQLKRFGSFDKAESQMYEESRAILKCKYGVTIDMYNITIYITSEDDLPRYIDKTVHSQLAKYYWFRTVDASKDDAWDAWHEFHDDKRPERLCSLLHDWNKAWRDDEKAFEHVNKVQIEYYINLLYLYDDLID